MSSNLTIKQHWEVRFRDIDPDTGGVSTDKPIAITMSEAWSELICEALGKLNDEPNRDFYTRKINEDLIKSANKDAGY